MSRSSTALQSRALVNTCGHSEKSNYRYNVYRLDISSGAIDRLTDLTGTIEGLSLSADSKKAVLLHNGGYYLLDVNSYQLAPIPLRNFE